MQISQVINTLMDNAKPVSPHKNMSLGERLTKLVVMRVVLLMMLLVMVIYIFIYMLITDDRVEMFLKRII